MEACDQQQPVLKQEPFPNSNNNNDDDNSTTFEDDYLATPPVVDNNNSTPISNFLNQNMMSSILFDQQNEQLRQLAANLTNFGAIGFNPYLSELIDFSGGSDFWYSWLIFLVNSKPLISQQASKVAGQQQAHSPVSPILSQSSSQILNQQNNLQASGGGRRANRTRFAEWQVELSIDWKRE